MEYYNAIQYNALSMMKCLLKTMEKVFRVAVDGMFLKLVAALKWPTKILLHSNVIVADIWRLDTTMQHVATDRSKSGSLTAYQQYRWPFELLSERSFVVDHHSTQKFQR
jgi:hypothetical protein